MQRFWLQNSPIRDIVSGKIHRALLCTRTEATLYGPWGDGQIRSETMEGKQ